MSKKVYLRRKDLDGHLPKAVRAEAKIKLSSVFVNRQPLKGFDSKDEKKYLDNGGKLIFPLPEIEII